MVYILFLVKAPESALSTLALLSSPSHLFNTATNAIIGSLGGGGSNRSHGAHFIPVA